MWEYRKGDSISRLFYIPKRCSLFGFCFDIWGNELVPFSMNIDYFYWWIVFEMFTKFGNVNVHATSVKVIIVYPNSFEGEVTLQNFIDVSTEQTEQFGLFGGEFSTLIVDSQY